MILSHANYLCRNHIVYATNRTTTSQSNYIPTTASQLSRSRSDVTISDWAEASRIPISPLNIGVLTVLMYPKHSLRQHDSMQFQLGVLVIRKTRVLLCNAIQVNFRHYNASHDHLDRLFIGLFDIQASLESYTHANS